MILAQRFARFNVPNLQDIPRTSLQLLRTLFEPNRFQNPEDCNFDRHAYTDTLAYLVGFNRYQSLCSPYTHWLSDTLAGVTLIFLTWQPPYTTHIAFWVCIRSVIS